MCVGASEHHVASLKQTHIYTNNHNCTRAHAMCFTPTGMPAWINMLAALKQAH